MATECVRLRSLTWSQELLRSLQEMRKSGEMCNLTVVCGEGEPMKVHGFLLSMASPFFKNILKDKPGSTITCNLADFPRKIVEYILEFVYSGTATVMKSDLVLLQGAAVSLNFPVLAHMVQCLIQQDITDSPSDSLSLTAADAAPQTLLTFSPTPAMQQAGSVVPKPDFVKLKTPSAIPEQKSPGVSPSCPTLGKDTDTMSRSKLVEKKSATRYQPPLETPTTGKRMPRSREENASVERDEVDVPKIVSVIGGVEFERDHMASMVKDLVIKTRSQQKRERSTSGTDIQEMTPKRRSVRPTCAKTESVKSSGDAPGSSPMARSFKRSCSPTSEPSDQEMERSEGDDSDNGEEGEDRSESSGLHTPDGKTAADNHQKLGVNYEVIRRRTLTSGDPGDALPMRRGEDGPKDGKPGDASTQVQGSIDRKGRGGDAAVTGSVDEAPVTSTGYLEDEMSVAYMVVSETGELQLENGDGVVPTMPAEVLKTLGLLTTAQSEEHAQLAAGAASAARGRTKMETDVAVKSLVQLQRGKYEDSDGEDTEAPSVADDTTKPLPVHAKPGYRQITRHNSTAQISLGPHFECDLCGHTFAALDYLLKHRVKHSDPNNPKRFSCPFCPHTTNYMAVLKSHMLIHTGEKPYECKFCQKKFRHQKTCRNHMRQHTGEKPYHCEYCEKRFYERTHLVVHVRTKHTKERPFVCEICHKTFGRSEQLKKHKVFHGPSKLFPCSLCPKGYMDKNHLLDHIRIKHEGDNSQPFQCPVCGRGYNRRDSLSMHRRLKHKPGDAPDPVSIARYEASRRTRDKKQTSKAKGRQAKAATRTTAAAAAAPAAAAASVEDDYVADEAVVKMEQEEEDEEDGEEGETSEDSLDDYSDIDQEDAEVAKQQEMPAGHS